tara:strand:+ start:602 stop:1507 length:906 start_codon:yes stop_codon:yes gene_type:complete
MSSLDYRKQRINDISSQWLMDKRNNYFLEKQIKNIAFKKFKNSIKLYISKAMHIDFDENDAEFLINVDKAQNNLINITPNGAVVPKKEYCIEYNLFLKNWCEIIEDLIKPSIPLLKKFRVTPNIRIKFGTEIKDNVNRELNTTIPHSDSWVEGPFGLNMHVPIMGDCEFNYLCFYKLKNENNFKDSFLETSESYNNMQWVLENYVEDNIIPKQGYLNLSDYALLHKTKRNLNSGTRISIDTTILVGNHPIHPDRNIEYLDSIPKIGENLFIFCERSEKKPVVDKKTTYSNYTTGSLKRINL